MTEYGDYVIYALVQSHTPYPGEQRVALLPRVVRMMLPAVLEDVAGAGRPPERKEE